MCVCVCVCNSISVPQKFVKLIKSFHDDTKATVWLDSAAVEEIIMV